MDIFNSQMIDPIDVMGASSGGGAAFYPVSGGPRSNLPIPMPSVAIGSGQMQQPPAFAMPPAAMSGGQLIPPPSFSQKLMNAGLAMINAEQSGIPLGGQMAIGMQAYNDTLEQHRQSERKARAEQLAEYELLGRIRERQMAEMQAARRIDTIEKMKGRYPELADLMDIDMNAASDIIASRFRPQERKIITQDGVAYYADTGERVLANVPPPPKMPFDGTGMDAQAMNILLSGDPGAPEYKAAFNYMGQEKLMPDGTRITPDMSAFRLPMEASTMPPALPAGFVDDGMSSDPLAIPSSAVPVTAPAPAFTPRMGAKSSVTPSTTKASVQGYDIEEGAVPTMEDAKAVKEIVEAHQNIKSLFDEREKIVKNNPNPTVGSADAIRLDQNTNQLALKIKALEQTGALDKGSVDVMMNAIGDPVIRGVSLSNPIKSTRESLTKKSGGKALTDELTKSGRAYIDNTLESAVSSRGYKKAVEKDKKKTVDDILNKYLGGGGQ